MKNQSPGLSVINAEILKITGKAGYKLVIHVVNQVIQELHNTGIAVLLSAATKVMEMPKIEAFIEASNSWTRR